MQKAELLNAIKTALDSKADTDTKIEDIIENINRYHEELALDLKDSFLEAGQ